LLEPPHQLTNNLKILEQSKEMFRLLPGDFFGELALKNNASRSCTIKAIEMSTCAVLTKEDFLKVTGGESYRKEFELVFQFLQESCNFEFFDKKELRLFGTKLSQISMSTGKLIIDQGKDCFHLYILKAGSVRIKRKIFTGSVDTSSFPDLVRKRAALLPAQIEVEVATKCKPGDLLCFFEIIHNLESFYKIECAIPSTFYRSSASDFYEIFKGKDTTKIPGFDQASPSNEILLRHYVDKLLWDDYSKTTLKSETLQLEMEQSGLFDYYKHTFEENTSERKERLQNNNLRLKIGNYFKQKQRNSFTKQDEKEIAPKSPRNASVDSPRSIQIAKQGPYLPKPLKISEGVQSRIVLPNKTVGNCIPSLDIERVRKNTAFRINSDRGLPTSIVKHDRNFSNFSTNMKIGSEQTSATKLTNSHRNTTSNFMKEKPKKPILLGFPQYLTTPVSVATDPQFETLLADQTVRIINDTLKSFQGDGFWVSDAPTEQTALHLAKFQELQQMEADVERLTRVKKDWRAPKVIKRTLLGHIKPVTQADIIYEKNKTLASTSRVTVPESDIENAALDCLKFELKNGGRNSFDLKSFAQFAKHVSAKKTKEKAASRLRTKNPGSLYIPKTRQMTEQ